MKLKKIGAVLVAAAFLFSASAGVADAARGGGRIAAPRASAPKAPAPKESAPAAKNADRPNQEYAPSKKAADLNGNAPAAGANRNAAGAAANAAANTGTRWGSALRSVGLLAGGMMLGSMLGSLFGFGGGFMADAMGLLFNVIFAVIAVKLILMLVRRFSGKKNEQTGGEVYGRREAPQYGNGSAVNSGPAVTDIRRDGDGLVNVSPVGSSMGTDYDPKAAADKYRHM